MYRCTEVQKYSSTEVQKYRCTDVQKKRNTEAHTDRQRYERLKEIRAKRQMVQTLRGRKIVRFKFVKNYFFDRNVPRCFSENAWISLEFEG